MKTAKNLFQKITCFENLLRASRTARRGKRFRTETARFEYHLENELLTLQRELTEGYFQPGNYRSFQIFEPKERLISAAPYRDRVVHHAICQIIEPIFDRTFITTSYACQSGKGTHKALLKFQDYSCQFPWVLQCDIQKFFPSIDHDILLQRIRRKIGCQRTLELIEKIISNSNPQEEMEHYFPGDDLFTPYMRRRGLPIGNLTSQLFANVYLNPLDHFIKEQLHQPPYLRYMDDFAVFGHSKEQLWEICSKIKHYLASFRLKIHPKKCQVLRVREGCQFLGFRNWPTHRIPLKQKSRRYQRHLQKLCCQYNNNEISLDRIHQSIQSWVGHVRWGSSYRLRTRVLGRVRLTKGTSY